MLVDLERVVEKQVRAALEMRVVQAMEEQAVVQVVQAVEVLALVVVQAVEVLALVVVQAVQLQALVVVQGVLVVETQLRVELQLAAAKEVELLPQRLPVLQQAQLTPQFRSIRLLQKNSQSQRLRQITNRIRLDSPVFLLRCFTTNIRQVI
jgi:hypothetical protein